MDIKDFLHEGINGYQTMRRIDRKTQMMDAGQACFTSAESFGAVIGSVRAQLGRFGTVLAVGDDGGAFGSAVRPEELPRSTGPADFFMDYSTPWRSRYISCKVEDAGKAAGQGGGTTNASNAPTEEQGNTDANDMHTDETTKASNAPTAEQGYKDANDTHTTEQGDTYAGNDGTTAGHERGGNPGYEIDAAAQKRAENECAGGDGMNDSTGGSIEGTERYAARLKEGNRSTPLRLWTLIALAVAAFAAGCFVCHGFIWTVAGIAVALWLLWTLIAPSKAARKTLLAVKRGIEEGRKA